MSCSLLHPTVTQLPGFTIEWNQLWCSINICWMNEFSNFCAFAPTYHWCLTCNESSLRDLPAGGAGEAKSLRSQCRGPGLIPSQGTRSHMPQLRVCMPHLKTLRAPTKDPVCVCVCEHVCEWLSRVRLFGPHGLQPTRLLCPWDSPGKNTGVGCHVLLQGIFRERTESLYTADSGLI